MTTLQMAASTLEALERAVAEIEALQAIYDNDLVVHSTSELFVATNAIEKGETIETLLEVSLQLDRALKLKCALPSGYPVTAAARVSVSVDERTRREQEEFTARIQNKANQLLGQESILELVHELQEMIEASKDLTANTAAAEKETTVIQPFTSHRCWIWVHHITNTDRRKSIVQEARELNLGGYLKSGYPGIVLVEGEGCDEFISWIKGSKSRPGGFGRNWGHHVKGQIEITIRQLPLEFTEIDEIKLLGEACKERGLEEEFLEYVMQHKGYGV